MATSPTSSKATPPIRKAEQALRDHGLSHPGSYEEFPWGHRALKVKKKIFAILVADADGLSVSVKLPESNGMALSFPFAKPTEYGLGKSGWVTAVFAPKEKIPVGLLKQWVDESFQAIAPKPRVRSRALAPRKQAKRS